MRLLKKVLLLVACSGNLFIYPTATPLLLSIHHQFRFTLIVCIVSATCGGIATKAFWFVCHFKRICSVQERKALEGKMGALGMEFLLCQFCSRTLCAKYALLYVYAYIYSSKLGFRGEKIVSIRRSRKAEKMKEWSSRQSICFLLIYQTIIIRPNDPHQFHLHW